jgi:Integron Cassette Protein Hfx_Cass5
MQHEAIIEIGIDALDRLYICPAITSFDCIWRAAMEVRWDGQGQRLFSPKPREWSYIRWFEQILAAAADEYGIQLHLTTQTIWSNVPEDLRSAISDKARKTA